MKTAGYSAAGGVVVDGELVLVLHRPARGEVRLPKGHIDEGETAVEAAVREVTEESGYADLEVLADLGEQTVSFGARKQWGGESVQLERHERYFLMRLVTHRTVAVHWDGMQFEPDWVTWDEAEELLTFEPEREWVRRARVANATP